MLLATYADVKIAKRAWQDGQGAHVREDVRSIGMT